MSDRKRPRVLVSRKDKRSVRISDASIRDAVLHVLVRERSSATVAVAVVGDGTMRRLHRDFMGVDSPTDVLTFPIGGPGSFLGEVVACAGVARRESKARGSRARDELLLYVVHGCLHLLGYDDVTDDGYARMHRREAKLLSEIGVEARVEVS